MCNCLIEVGTIRVKLHFQGICPSSSCDWRGQVTRSYEVRTHYIDVPVVIPDEAKKSLLEDARQELEAAHRGVCPECSGELSVSQSW